MKSLLSFVRADPGIGQDCRCRQPVSWVAWLRVHRLRRDKGSSVINDYKYKHGIKITQASNH
ncbi:hypothetical protein AS026_35550 [Rhizobium altiplani]|uniref:Uncharacterized protein n=1 Tax=Rhizobium altiplani TaxID=1864509 RepID=A0A120FP06_9HYPH|nr:hypothetical protein AS026_35550 [Rhizobium altiplani]